jgi:hypothetical protein
MAARRLAEVERLVPLARLAAEAAAVREAQQVPRVVAAQPRAAPEAAEVWDVAVARQPVAASAGVAARRLEEAAAEPASAAVRLRGAEAAALGAAAARPRGAEEAAPDAEGVRPRGAEAEAPDAEGVPHRVGRDEGGLLLAAAWAGLPSTRLQGDRPAPSARARSAHARGS